MNLKKVLPLLLLMICFSACVERIERKISHDVTPPEYTVEKEDLKSRIASILPAQEVNITTSRTETTGKPEFQTLHVELKRPENFPSNGFSFAGVAADIQEIVENGVSNIDEYQKMEIIVRHVVEENGIKHNRSYTKTVEL